MCPCTTRTEVLKPILALRSQRTLPCLAAGPRTGPPPPSGLNPEPSQQAPHWPPEGVVSPPNASQRPFALGASEGLALPAAPSSPTRDRVPWTPCCLEGALAPTPIPNFPVPLPAPADPAQLVFVLGLPSRRKTVGRTDRQRGVTEATHFRFQSANYFMCFPVISKGRRSTVAVKTLKPHRKYGKSPRPSGPRRGRHLGAGPSGPAYFLSRIPQKFLFLPK